MSSRCKDIIWIFFYGLSCFRFSRLVPKNVLLTTTVQRKRGSQKLAHILRIFLPLTSLEWIAPTGSVFDQGIEEKISLLESSTTHFCSLKRAKLWRHHTYRRYFEHLHSRALFPRVLSRAIYGGPMLLAPIFYWSFMPSSTSSILFSVEKRGKWWGENESLR